MTSGLLLEVARWMIVPRRMVALGLICALVASAFGVSYSAYETRRMYAELQSLEKLHDDLENEFEKLLLERSAQARYTRLSQLAKEDLAMVFPKAGDMVVLK